MKKSKVRVVGGCLLGVGFCIASINLFALPFLFGAVIPLKRLEGEAHSLIGYQRAPALQRLDHTFGEIDNKAKKRLVFEAASAELDLAHEVQRMTWRPVPRKPKSESVVEYIVLWNAVFVYFGEDGKVTRVVACST